MRWGGRELHESIRACFRETVSCSTFLSYGIEKIFRTYRPSHVEAKIIRGVLFQALRYNDIEGAIKG